MGLMTDIMVDTETTGTAPDQNGIMQLVGVKFNFQTGEIGEVFNRCPSLLPLRYWDEDTRIWWNRMPDTLHRIIARMEEPIQVFRDFSMFCSDAPYRMWAKPIHFDFPFLASHYRQLGLPMPLHFRWARDLNTFMAAMAGGAEHQKMEHIDMSGPAHDALPDSIHQLKMLFAAKKRDFGIIDAEFEDVLG